MSTFEDRASAASAIDTKAAQREELERLTAKFLERGGAVKKLKAGPNDLDPAGDIFIDWRAADAIADVFGEHAVRESRLSNHPRRLLTDAVADMEAGAIVQPIRYGDLEE